MDVQGRDIYTYKDKDGNTIVTNTPIPERYENKAEKIDSYKEATPPDRNQWERESELRKQRIDQKERQEKIQKKFLEENRNRLRPNVSFDQRKKIIIKKLRWSDFRGFPEYGDRFDATAPWHVYYEYDEPVFVGNQAKITFRVWNALDPRSWVNLSESDELLNHEQGHYDTGVICALEFKKRLSTCSFTKSNYRNEIEQVFQEVLGKHINMDKRYDRQTNHSQYRDAQARWDNFFQGKIAELRQYQ